MDSAPPLNGAPLVTKSDGIPAVPNSDGFPAMESSGGNTASLSKSVIITEANDRKNSIMLPSLDKFIEYLREKGLVANRITLNKYIRSSNVVPTMADYSGIRPMASSNIFS
jgi:hypothetical protein